MKNESGFTPTGDLVLVLPAVVPEKSAGGIALVDETLRKEQEATQVGWVVAIGNTARDHPRMNAIGVGTQILFTRYQQNTLPVNKTRYFIIRADSILGITDKFPDYALNAARPSLEVFGANEAPQAA